MGLVRWSEEALEAKQGHAPNIRKSRCFQGDLVENLKQCYQQLQLQSDLVINRKFAFRSKENVSRTLFAINFEFGITNFIIFIYSGPHTMIIIQDPSSYSRIWVITAILYQCIMYIFMCYILTLYDNHIIQYQYFIRQLLYPNTVLRLPRLDFPIFVLYICKCWEMLCQYVMYL